MKKTLLCLCYILSGIFSLQAQSLFGITYSGGSDDGGCINKYVPSSNSLSVERSFQRSGANPYYTSLTRATDGKFYGMTFNGGGSSGGVIFSYDPDSAIYSKIYDFDIINGSKPTGSMIQANDGKLYGMTSFGGVQNVGVIFSLDPSSHVYTKLYDFDITNGAGPSGSLLQSSDGKLYGMAAQGGSNNFGVIFSFDPSSGRYSKLKDFQNTDGASPLGNLIAGTNGMLYGMTTNGGNNLSGVIFSYNISSSVFSKLKDFDSTNGYYPYGSLMQANDGKFYGTTYKGGSNNYGVIFSFDPASSAYTKLEDLDSANGGSPFGNLLQADNGKLYGMTSLGGTANAGVIFSFDPLSLVYARLQNFDNTKGAGPSGSLTPGDKGSNKLYGMTFQGGTSNDGVIFSFDDSSSRYIKLKDFGTNVFGRRPSGSLVKSASGILYGMTAFGGTNNDGVIFSFDPFSSEYTKLLDFDSLNGANPYGSLIQATDGKLYGMTFKGGTRNAGIIFSYDIPSSTYTKLKDLDSSNGSNPYGSLVQATDGKLYGMTYYGGSKTFGTIFSFDPVSSAYSKLKDFDNANGANPYGNLVQGSDGKLYGMTFAGGNGYIFKGDTTGVGVIFSFDPSSSIFTKLKVFNYDNGGFATGSLLRASDNKFYGLTSAGGVNEVGVIFSYDAVSASFTKLGDFDITKGANPYGNLMQANNGKLYGMSYQGGNDNFGTLFSFDPASSTFVKLLDYNDENGANPFYGSAFIEVPESGPLPVTLLSFTGKNNGNNNTLSWEVANELRPGYYELERSSDARNFIGISQIKAIGNSDYFYNDYLNAASTPINYYRLKTVDKDGIFKYSDVVKLSSNADKDFVLVTPNPFTNNLLITITSAVGDRATLILSDISGKQLHKESILLYPGSNVRSIDETSKLPTGAYLLTIISSQQTKTIRVLKGN